MNSKILKLPKGFPTLFDEAMIECLCRDDEYRASFEEEYGKILRIYPDWAQGHLVYELIDGDCKYSDLKDLCKKLEEIKYMDAWHN
jgi:hypothetical protein